MLKEAIKLTKDKIEKERQDDNNKKIPEGFMDFAESPQFRELLEAMLDYNKELIRLETKQQVLELEAKQRGLQIPPILPSEKKKLYEKAKKMADKYSWIVFTHKSIGSKDDHKIHSFM